MHWRGGDTAGLCKPSTCAGNGRYSPYSYCNCLPNLYKKCFNIHRIAKFLVLPRRNQLFLSEQTLNRFLQLLHWSLKHWKRPNSGTSFAGSTGHTAQLPLPSEQQALTTLTDVPDGRQIPPFDSHVDGLTRQEALMQQTLRGLFTASHS